MIGRDRIKMGRGNNSSWPRIGSQEFWEEVVRMGMANPVMIHHVYPQETSDDSGEVIDREVVEEKEEILSLPPANEESGATGDNEA
ncbi:MAG: hypothetical protein KGL39_16505 [Patescibacteria group bacterium]|nr:hypothetical protein [Patescibacteria group bacterium]